MGSVRLERARDRTDRAHRRVLALTFGPDFIHWRRSGESWPSVWPGRRLFYLMNEPVAAEVEQVWGRSASSGLATGRTGSHRRVLALTFGPDFIHWRRSGESWPIVGPGRRLFYLMNEPVAAEVEQVWGRSASSGLATGRTGSHRI